MSMGRDEVMADPEAGADVCEGLLWCLSGCRTLHASDTDYVIDAARGILALSLSEQIPCESEDCPRALAVRVSGGAVSVADGKGCSGTIALR